MKRVFAHTLGAIAVVTTLAAGATPCHGSLGFSGTGWADRDPDEQALGMTFRDPEVLAAVKMTEDGAYEQAVQRLKSILTDGAPADGDRKKELRLGLGMVHLRQGKLSEMRSVLDPLARARDRSGVIGRRARAIEFVVDKLILNGDSRWKRVTTRAEWEEGLRDGKREMQNSNKQTHDKIMQLFKEDKWGGISQHLQEAGGHVDMAATISVDFERTRRILQQHGEALRALVDAVNNERTRADEAIIVARHKRDQLPADKAHKSDKERLQNEIDRLKDRYRRLWDTGQPVVEEYRRVKQEYSNLAEFGEELRIAVHAGVAG